MLPAAHSALAFVVIALLVAQAPSKPTTQQRESDREHARQLFARAAALIEQIEDPSQRFTAWWQLGIQQSLAGFAEQSGASFDASIATMQKLAPDQPRLHEFKRSEIMNALGRAGDLTRARQIIDAAPEASRDSLLARYVFGYSFSRPTALREAANLTMQIKKDERARENTLAYLLRSRGHTAQVEDLEHLLTLLKEPANRAMAQALLGAAKIRTGDPTGDRDLIDATQSAGSVDRDPSGGGGLVGCVDMLRDESPRDSSLREVARIRLQAGDIAGALATVMDVETDEGRDELLANIALVQGAKGDVVAAQQTASRISQPTCRDIALEGIAYARLKDHDLAAALQIASSLSTPYARAQAYYGLATRQLWAKDKASALRIAVEGYQHSTQILEMNDRVTLAAWLAVTQADAGGLSVARQNMNQLALDFAKFAKQNPRRVPLNEMSRIAVCQAGLGDATLAISVLDPAKSPNGMTVLLSMARHATRTGDIADALKWIGDLPAPAEKAFALIGAGAGLLAGRATYSRC